MDPAEALVAQETARYRVINETIARGDSPVQQFYAGAVVLVTGASGFLGKQLVEKLLRSCEIKKIFILLRANKHGNAKDRISKLLTDSVYDCLRDMQPKFENKLEVVSGDVTKPRLGLSDDDWNNITEEVTIIFHGAATISFTEPLKQATLTNVCGTKEVIFLAKECKKLRSFVHISSAYTHANDLHIGKEVLEQFYESPMSPEALIQIAKGTEEDTLDTITPQIIKGWSNTYSFTKAVAEELVRTTAADLPVCILRPAIVINTCREPVPAWIDKGNVMGASGLVVGIGVGVLHVLKADKNSRLDLVPVDMVNNAAIIAAQETAQRRARGLNDVKIYTVSTDRNPLTFGRLLEVLFTDGRQNYLSLKLIWHPCVTTTTSALIYKIFHFFMHFVPGYLIDGFLMVSRRKPMLTKVYKTAYKLNSVLGYYTINTWKFRDSNLRELYHRLSPADRTIYYCDMETVDWSLYLVLWWISIRKYILKDGLKDRDKVIRKTNILRIVHYIFVLLYVYVVYMIIYFVFNTASSILL